MSIVFTSEENQFFFERNGYVKLKLLSSKSTKHLLSFYYSLQKEHLVVPNLYHSTSDTSNRDLIDRVAKEVQEVVLNDAGHLFKNVEFLIGNFLVKESGIGSETKPHQDWTFVEEENNVSFNIWTGLHNITSRKGNLFFVPGSHKFVNSLRVGPQYPSAFEKVYNLLPYFWKEEPTLEGEGFVINHACIHGATENLSGTPRVASVVAGYTANTQLLHYFMEEEFQVEKFLVSSEDFITLEKNKRPREKRAVSIQTHHFKQIEKDEFFKKIIAQQSNLKKIPAFLKALWLNQKYS